MSGVGVANPDGIAITADGALLFSEFNSGLVKSISTSAFATSVAGGGALVADGFPATSVTLGGNSLTGVTVDAMSGFYVALYASHTVVYVNSTGIAVRFAGTAGSAAYSGDGASARAAKLNMPEHAVVDSAGAGVFISDYGNHVVRYVTLATGVIKTVAGTGASGWTGGE